MLTPIGIGSGTALGSAVIDANKRAGNEQDTHQLVAQQQALQNQKTQLTTSIQRGPGPADLLAVQDQIAQVTSKLNQVTAQLQTASAALQPISSHGFLTDVLSDANGISFHRFQMMGWTLVLGAVFMFSVYHTLSMPNFNGTLLALMGISSGTYLGFKFPEQHV